MKRIKYIGFYDLIDNSQNRVGCISAINKMNYISSVIVRAGYKVEIISPSWIKDNEYLGFQKQKSIKVNKNVWVTFCPSWGTKSKIARNWKIIFSLLWLFIYLVTTVKRNEKIIVYHVQWFSIPIKFAKLFKKFKLVLEIEEIYSDVIPLKKIFNSLENMLIKTADYFLYSTELLNRRINISKPYIICHGVYKTDKLISQPINDGKIHLLYAGIIDFNSQNNAFIALESTKYLSDKYILHIIGFGETIKLCNRINELNLLNKCKIIFDGLKSGDDFINYCSKCHIGLNTQPMDKPYLQSSFPAKIISYLSMGLRVVSSYVDCVYKSKIRDLVTYYYQDDPKVIAKTIMNIDINEPFDGISKLNNLDKEFVTKIKNLIK